MLHLKVCEILIDDVSQLVGALSDLKMHVQQNTNARWYVKMLSFSTDKILLLRLENLAQGKENSVLKKLFMYKGSYLAEGKKKNSKVKKKKKKKYLPIIRISMEMNKGNCQQPSEWHLTEPRQKH